jgi:hypothetical protein
MLTPLMEGGIEGGAPVRLQRRLCPDADLIKAGARDFSKNYPDYVPPPVRGLDPLGAIFKEGQERAFLVVSADMVARSDGAHDPSAYVAFRTWMDVQGVSHILHLLEDLLVADSFGAGPLQTRWYVVGALCARVLLGDTHACSTIAVRTHRIVLGVLLLCGKAPGIWEAN